MACHEKVANLIFGFRLKLEKKIRKRRNCLFRTEKETNNSVFNKPGPGPDQIMPKDLWKMQIHTHLGMRTYLPYL